MINKDLFQLPAYLVQADNGLFLKIGLQVSVHPLRLNMSCLVLWDVCLHLITK